MTMISHRGTVRTTSPARVLYLKYIKGHEITTMWCKPRFFLFGLSICEVRWTLVPPHRAGAWA